MSGLSRQARLVLASSLSRVTQLAGGNGDKRLSSYLVGQGSQHPGRMNRLRRARIGRVSMAGTSSICPRDPGLLARFLKLNSRFET